ncbi:MAG TPA: cell wall hydrolase [Sphingomonas sp.]|nr:cell wall hydrolase [Sphingomonas sp.]
MYMRSAIGFAILLASASCVGPRTAVEAPSAAPAIAVKQPVAPAPASVVPAGPSAELLAIAPLVNADSPASLLTEAPAFVNTAEGENADRALDCLTAAVYYEARSEPLDGQRAVAQVVLNRVRNPAFPNSVCGVVYQGANRSTGCQFTFTCDGSMYARREPAAWERARKVAEDALTGSVYAPVGLATYYHTTTVSPAWDADVIKVAQIGAHNFYRWGGRWGGLLDFRQHYAGVEPSLAQAVLLGDKSTDEILQEIGGVTIHRGGSTVAAGSGPAMRSGVRVHYGDAGPLAPADPAPASAAAAT